MQNDQLKVTTRQLNYHFNSEIILDLNRSCMKLSRHDVNCTGGIPTYSDIFRILNYLFFSK